MSVAVEPCYPVTPLIRDPSMVRPGAGAPGALSAGPAPPPAEPPKTPGFLHEHWVAIAIGAAVVLALVLAALLVRGFEPKRPKCPQAACSRPAAKGARGGAQPPPAAATSDLELARAERRNQRAAEAARAAQPPEGPRAPGAPAGPAERPAQPPDRAAAGPALAQAPGPGLVQDRDTRVPDGFRPAGGHQPPGALRPGEAPATEQPAPREPGGGGESGPELGGGAEPDDAQVPDTPEPDASPISARPEGFRAATGAGPDDSVGLADESALDYTSLLDELADSAA